MGKNSRRRNRAQRPSTSNVRSRPGRQPKTQGLPQGERTSLDDDWIDASITELDPKDDFDLDVVKQLIAEKIAAAIAELPTPVDLEAVKQLSVAVSKSEMTAPRGPAPTDDWYWVIIGEAYIFEKEHGYCAGTGKLSELCGAKTKTGYSPDPDQITKLFRRNFFGHKIGKDPKPASAGRVSRRRS